MSIPICTCRGVLGNLVNRLFSSPFSGPLGQSVRWKNLFEMHMRGGRPERRPQPKSPISGHPQMRGVVLKVLIKKPKKPNSANRKCVLVRLTNGKETVAWIPGEGHNLQEHSQVLVEGGRKPDLIGVKVRVIRGKLDCAPVVKEKR
ncbi:ribosomal protein S12 [Trichuris suis]|nr:ribosomal protein S12 [Trichuris suis]